jgi:hypothetical protein
MRDHDVDLADPGLALDLAALRQSLSVINGATSGTGLSSRMKPRLATLDVTAALQLQIRVLAAMLLRLVLANALLHQRLVFGVVRNRPTGRISRLADHPLATLLRCHAVVHERSSKK